MQREKQLESIKKKKKDEEQRQTKIKWKERETEREEEVAGNRYVPSPAHTFPMGIQP